MGRRSKDQFNSICTSGGAASTLDLRVSQFFREHLSKHAIVPDVLFIHLGFEVVLSYTMQFQMSTPDVNTAVTAS